MFQPLVQLGDIDPVVHAEGFQPCLTFDGLRAGVLQGLGDVLVAVPVGEG